MKTCRKRLIIVSKNFLPQRGGAETFTFQLAENVAAGGVSVEILTGVQNPEIPEGCRVQPCLLDSRRLPGGWFFLPVLSASVSLLRYARRGCVLFFPQLDATIVSAWLLRHLFGLRYIIRVPGVRGPNNQLDNIARSRFSAVLLRALRGADSVVVQSDADVAPIEEVGVQRRRIHCVPNGVDLEKFEFRQPTDNDRKLIVGCIMRLSYEKGIDRLLDLMKLAGSTIHWRIVGTGPYRDAVTNLASASNQIEYEIELARDEMPKFFHGIDVLLNISRAEGMSNAILEALACGVPVVASSIPNNMIFSEVVNVFEEDDLVECLSRLNNLAGNFSECRKVARRGRAFVELSHDLTSIAGIYSELLFCGEW